MIEQAGAYLEELAEICPWYMVIHDELVEASSMLMSEPVLPLRVSLDSFFQAAKTLR